MRLRRPTRKGLKRLAARLALLVASLTVLYLVLEFFLFQHLLTILPLRTTWQLDEGIRVLSQSSKDGVVPEDYIALVGDSYAEGKGDWYRLANKSGRPDYHSAHVIHELTGRDVVTFGASGAGSLRGLVGEPLAQFEFVNRRSQFTMDPPSVVLVYFYEGNDLNDNLADLRARFTKLRDPGRVREPAYFDAFIEEVVHHGDPVYVRAREGSDRLFFARWLSGVTGYLIGKTFKSSGKKEKKEDPGPPPPAPVGAVRVAGESVSIPNGVQAPSLELTEEELRLGTWVFERSLRYLMRAFPDAAVGVLYVPSPLSCYDIVSDRVSAQSYEGRGTVFPAGLVAERSDAIAALIEEAAHRAGAGFRDARPLLRRRAAEVLIHGPRDWEHLNETGYRTLAEAAVELIEDLGRSNGD